jgi:hypothetical protein
MRTGGLGDSAFIRAPHLVYSQQDPDGCQAISTISTTTTRPAPAEQAAKPAAIFAMEQRRLTKPKKSPTTAQDPVTMAQCLLTMEQQRSTMEQINHGMEHN